MVPTNKHVVFTTIASGLLATTLTNVPVVQAGPPQPAWETVIEGPDRFKVLAGFNGEAVLDKETGLVWERAPDPSVRTGFNAQAFCNNKVVGGRKGWRLPSIQELTSLVEPNNRGEGVDLPLGHPFSEVQSFFYWSTTGSVAHANDGWVMDLTDGDAVVDGRTGMYLTWCVRGGFGGADEQ